MSIPKFKQTFEVEYKYFNDSKTVVAYVRANNTIKTNRTNRTKRIYFETMTNYELPCFKVFKGVARFKTGDTFDISEAEKVARKKAVRAYYKHVRSLLNEAMVAHQKRLNDQKEFLQQLNNKITTLTDEIKEEK